MRCPASAGQQHPTVEGFRAVGHVMSDLHQVIPTGDAPSHSQMLLAGYYRSTG